MLRHPLLPPPPAIAEAFMGSIDALRACINEVDAAYTDADANDFKLISALFNKVCSVPTCAGFRLMLRAYPSVCCGAGARG